MLEWSISELLMIAAFGLLLFSPKEIPRIVVQVVRAVRQVRDRAQRLLTELEEEFDRENNDRDR